MPAPPATRWAAAKWTRRRCWTARGSASDGGPGHHRRRRVQGQLRRRRRAEQPLGGRRSSSSGASRRRETADPAQLGAAPGVPARGTTRRRPRPDEPAAAARAAPDPRAAKPRRRMTCDPRLLNRLVMGKGGVPTIPRDERHGCSRRAVPRRRPRCFTFDRLAQRRHVVPVLKVARSNHVSL